jgi:hypothetical protein
MLLAFLVFAWYYFGIKYFLLGNYYFDWPTDLLTEIYPPYKYFSVSEKFSDNEALTVISMIRLAIYAPKVAEHVDIQGPEEWQQRISVPDPIAKIEPVWGDDGKIYAVFITFTNIDITMLCFINLRYVRQWSCLFDSSLVSPSYMPVGLQCWSCVVHYYGQVRNKIWDRWSNYYRPRTKQLVIAGHSLGGAMSPLCALDLKLNDSSGFFDKPDKLVVYITGAPQCGNDEFVDRYNKEIPNTYNIINTFDMISMTPIQSVPKQQTYKHVGKVIAIGDSVVKYPAEHHYLMNYYAYFQEKTKLVQSST